MPLATARAERALDLILHGVRESCWPAVAWRFSRLGACGAPYEWAVSTSERAVRYTAEVAGPEATLRERLDRAQQLLRQLDPAAAALDALAPEIEATLEAGEPGWGAWIGGRHTDHESRYKLYVEAPRTATERAPTLVRRYLGTTMVVPHRRPLLEGIGYAADVGLVELYFRVAPLDIADIGQLLAIVGLARRQAELLDFMEDCLGRLLRPHLPGIRYGFSYAVREASPWRAFSLFVYAQDVFGTDQRSREHLLALAARLDLDLSLYERLSEPMATRTAGKTLHTVLAFSLPGSAAPALSIGLSPN
jgi:hypothetical protein